MLRVGQRILTGNIELIKPDIVQEHVDTAQVIGRNVNFLSIKAVAHRAMPQHLYCFEQQRTGTTSRVVNLVDPGLSHCPQTGQQLRYIRRSEELSARLSGIAGVHGHEIFIGITKGIDVVIFHVAQIHVGHTV